jgi:hypothetical protein
LLFGEDNPGEINASLPLRDFRIRYLSDDVVQVMYASEVKMGTEIMRANRSSIWRKKQNSWEILFHHGTPTK